MVAHPSPDRARARALRAWARLTTGRAGLVVLGCVLLAAVSGALAWGFLGFESDRSALVDPTLPWQRRYAEYKAAFPRWDDAVVVVDAKSAPDAATLEAYLDALDARLEADPKILRADFGFPTSEAPPGLILSLPTERIREVVAQMERAGPLLNAPSLGHLLSLSTLGLRLGQLDARSEADLIGLLERGAALAEATEGESPVTLLGAAPPAQQRFTTPSGALTLGLVALRDDGKGALGVQSGKAGAIGALRGRLDALRAEARFAPISAGVTGVPVVEIDETALSTKDSSFASILASALIALLAVVVYRGGVVPALIMAGLGLGLAASFGWAALSVGHLQVLSVVFMVMLVGLGADMTMHLISRLEVTHPDHAHMPGAIEDSFLAVGPGVVTGSLTTAAAFAATALTKFKGSAELGLIASGGVLLCTIVSLAFFPAALTLLPRPERALRAKSGGKSRPFLGGRANIIDRRPWPVVIAWLIALGVCVPLALHVRYDTDLLKMLPDAAESVRWERRLSDADEQSTWHAIVVARDAEEAAALTERLRALPEVADVSGAGLLFPGDLAAKAAALSAIPQPPDPLPEAEPLDPRPVAQQIAALAKNEALASAARRLAAIDDRGLARVHSAFARERGALAAQWRTLRGATPPSAADLPRALREQFVGTGGELLLRVFPRAPKGGGSVLAPENLKPFMRSVLGAAPGATGPTSQIYESARVIQRANVLGALYAGLVIVLFLLVDFRRIGDVLCAMLPVGVATLALLGLLGALGIDLNFANTIVAPLLLGLGVTAGVNAVHRWKQQPHDPPAGLAGGAGRAITLTLATTAIGFACMMTASHRGIRSLGLVMTLGLILVWASVVFLLPAVLRLRTRRYDPHAPQA